MGLMAALTTRPTEQACQSKTHHQRELIKAMLHSTSSLESRTYRNTAYPHNDTP